MKAPSRPRRALVVLTMLAGATAACSVILGLEPPPGGAGSSDAGADSDALVIAAGCPIRYVAATTGNDANDGCSPQAAKRTIKAAVGAVETLGVAGYTVEVCAGAYPETDLKILVAGSLLGGFDCTTWKRTATYRSDGVNETVISIASPDANNSTTLTLGVPPSDAGSAPLVVDGLTIRGPSVRSLSKSIAVQLIAGTGGTVSNCQILSGDASDASIAVSMPGASPEIRNNIIKSGSAAQTMGIYARTTGQAPSIHGNQIQAGDQGAGTAGILGSYGIYVTGPAVMTGAVGNPIADNAVLSGSGMPSIGIELQGVQAADVVHNHVEGGHVLPVGDGGTAAAPGIIGVVAYSSSDVHVLGNRIYGGGNLSGPGNFEGVTLQKVTGGIIANNMIYGGYRQPNDKSPGGASGISLFACTAPVVDSNTIFSGFGSSVRAINVIGGTTGALVRNNILAGGGTNDFGVRVDACSGEVANLEHNLFFGEGAGTLRLDCPDAGTTVADISGLAALKGAQVDGNLALRAVCDAADLDAGSCLVEPACTKVTGSADCLDTVFASWSTIDNGYTALFTGGWTLKDGVRCRIAQGGLDLSAPAAGLPITEDLYGSPRAKPPSMGAAQQDAGCTQ